jgi:hypothetical protein
LIQNIKRNTMSGLPRFDEMAVSTLRDECRNRDIAKDGDKPTLVARLASFEIDNIEAELLGVAAGSDLQEVKFTELSNRLQLAIIAKADQVFNVKSKYLTDELELLEADLAAIREERDKEKSEGMKRYEKAKMASREKEKGFAETVEQMGHGQESSDFEEENGDVTASTEEIKVRSSPRISRVALSKPRIVQPALCLHADRTISCSRSGKNPCLNCLEMKFGPPRNLKKMTSFSVRLLRLKIPAMMNISFS